jgi:hypothetical protein
MELLEAVLELGELAGDLRVEIPEILIHLPFELWRPTTVVPLCLLPHRQVTSSMVSCSSSLETKALIWSVKASDVATNEAMVTLVARAADITGTQSQSAAASGDAAWECRPHRWTGGAA